MNPQLILFDIDQTLIYTAGCGRRALEKALQEILKLDNALQDISMSGKTDTYIVFEVLEKNNLLQALSPKKDLLLWERYLFHLQNELKESTNSYILEGIPELLKEFRNKPHIYLGLLTGNIQKGAQSKLEHFGLWDYFQVGAFGDDHLDRNIVAQIAVDRSRKHFNQPFVPEDIFVIGDSVRDIAAAKAIRAKSIIAATGIDSYETLLDLKPTSLFHDFKDTQAILNVIERKANCCHANER